MLSQPSSISPATYPHTLIVVIRRRFNSSYTTLRVWLRDGFLWDDAAKGRRQRMDPTRPSGASRLGHGTIASQVWDLVHLRWRDIHKWDLDRWDLWRTRERTVGRQGIVSKGGRQRVGLTCDNIGKPVLLLHQYHVGICNAFLFIIHLLFINLFTYFSIFV